jgi:hypothetical protein
VLVVARIGLNLATHVVMDVGYAGAVGADRIVHGLRLYVDNAAHGDTYGPVNYLLYVPFNAIFGFDGHWTGGLAPAHAAAIAFDLLTLAGLFVLGRSLRRGAAGRKLGLALAYAWAACPFTLYALALNTNDAMVSALVVWAFVAVSSPARRGTLAGLAAAAKLAPFALVPLLAAGRGERRVRDGAIAVAAAVAVSAVAIAAYLPKAGGLQTFWNCTIGYQMTRQTDFSIWVQHPALHPLQLGAELAAAGLALLVAFVPRRRDTRQVAALGAAVLIALELAARHWFYFYVLWFLPLAAVAVFAMYETRSAGSVPDEIELSVLTGRNRLPV